MSRIRRMSRRVRLAVATLVTLLVVGLVAVAARAATSNDTGRYRTAVTEMGSVTETLATSGTVDATQRRDVAVAVAGTVSKVSVATGDKVKDGQVLVTLDHASAERALRKAKTILAQAKADLESAENAQTQVVTQANTGLGQSTPSGQSWQPSGGSTQPSGGPSQPAGGSTTPSGGPTTPTGGPTTPTGSPTTPTGSPTAPTSSPTTPTGSPTTPTSSPTTQDPLPNVTLPSVTELRALQKAVTTAQTATSTALSDAKAALAHQTKVCAQALNEAGTGSATNGDATSDSANGTSGNAAGDTPCQRALEAVQAAQQTVADKQAALQQATGALTDALLTAVQQTSEGVAALQSWIDAHSTPAGGGGPAHATNSNATNSRSATPSASIGYAVARTASGETAGDLTHAVSGVYFVPTDSTPTATTVATGGAAGAAGASAQSIASAQAAIDEAEAGLIQAEQNLAATTVTASAAGTVTAVDVAKGDSVGAGDVLVTVVGDGGATVTLSLTGTQVRKVTAGQKAKVTLPGADSSAVGTVTWVSPIATDTGSTMPFATASTYVAYVHVPAAELAKQTLAQGARSDVTITLGTRTNVLTVPISALVRGANDSSVQVVTADGTSTKSVTTGRMGGGRIEVLSGLAKGEAVVLADLDATIDAAGEISTGATGFSGGGNFPGRGNGFPGGNFPSGGTRARG